MYISPSWMRGESWKKDPRYREKLREIQRLEKEVRVKWNIKRKPHKENYPHSDFQRDGEINDSDTEMQTYTYTHWCRPGKKRTCWLNVEKCYSTGPHQHLHRLCTEQLQGVAFSIGHDMTEPQDLCNPNLHQDLGIHSSYSKLLINKWELNFKTLREIF